jgi:hypothetical protein
MERSLDLVFMGRHHCSQHVAAERWKRKAPDPAFPRGANLKRVNQKAGLGQSRIWWASVLEINQYPGIKSGPLYQAHLGVSLNFANL